MPPKSKRRLQLDKARENRYKKSRIETDREPLLNESFTTTVMSPVTDDCTEEIISEITALEDTQSDHRENFIPRRRPFRRDSNVQ